MWSAAVFEPAEPAQHPGQRLARAIAIGRQRMMAVSLEVRLSALLVTMRGDDRGVETDARHAAEGLVRDPDAGQGAMPRAASRPAASTGPLPRIG